MRANLLLNCVNKLLRSGSGRKRGHVPARVAPSWRPAVEALEDRITPSTFTVTDVADTAGSAGDVTLRYAVTNAASGDTINFSVAPASTITLGSALPAIAANITITGPGAANLAVSGGGSVQVFNIASGATATISGLTIENGTAASGGGINNSGTLTLNDDAFNNNSCTGFGGGVSNGTFGATATNAGATLTASNCTFNANAAGSTAGGLFNFGTLTLSDSTFTNNTAQWGPAVTNAGQAPGYNFNGVGLATITGCTMTNNTNTAANSGGGGVDNLNGTLTLSNSTISNNTCYSGGGANNNGGTLILINDTITNNTATYGGGGISTLNYFGSTAITTTIVTNCTVTGNTAGSGGGIFNNNGSVIMSSDTVSGNTATGTGPDIDNVVGQTLTAGDTNAFTSGTNINNDGTLNLNCFSNTMGTLTGSGTITNNPTYQIDNNQEIAGFNNTIGTETSALQNEDCWVGNVFTAVPGQTQLNSVSFLASFSGPLNSTTLPTATVTAALYTGAPGAGLTLIPGSVNTMALNADANTWVTVPFAASQNLNAGEVFTAVMYIPNVPNNQFPWSEDTSNGTVFGVTTNSYYDIDNPPGNIGSFDLAAPNNPTPNGVDYPGQPAGATNAYSDTTLLRANYNPVATLTVSGGGTFSGIIQDGLANISGGSGGTSVALTVAGANQTLTLSGSSTYSGVTTVDSGDTLLVDGSETGPVTVSAGGTLGGTGTTGALSGAGAVSPGDPPSSTSTTLTASSADFSAGDFTANISAPLTGDQLNVTGGVTLDGTSTLTLDLNGLTAPTGPITIISAGSVTGTFSAVNFVNNPNSFTANVTYTGTSVIVDIVTGAAAPTVTSVVVNGGAPVYTDSNGYSVSLAGQNSVVEQIEVTFSEAVNLSGGAITIVNNAAGVTVNSGAGPNTLAVNASWTAVAGSGNTQWIVTFSGPGTHTVSDPGAGGIGNIIDDGLYILHINAADVTAQVGGATMAADSNTGFWAMYGAVYDNTLSSTIGDGNSEVFIDANDEIGFAALFNNGYDSSQAQYAPLVGFDYDLDGFADADTFNTFAAGFNSGRDWVF